MLLEEFVSKLTTIASIPFDRVKQCHESEDKVAQRKMVAQHQLMIDSRGSCITGRLTQPVHVMRAVARHQQFIHSVCTDLVSLVLESCRSCRSCRQCISCRSCGLKLVFLTLSSRHISCTLLASRRPLRSRCSRILWGSLH